MKLATVVFASVTFLFFTLTVLPPYLSSGGNTGWIDFANTVFKPFCDQLPGHSLSIRGVLMPVCARCFGIYAGMLLGSLLYPMISKGKIPKGWIIFAAAAPLTIDGVTQLVGLRESTNILRPATGLLFGVVIPFYLIPILDEILNSRTFNGRADYINYIKE